MLNNAVKRLPGVKWSQTHKSWYIPLDDEHYRCVCKALSGLAHVEASQLRAYLVKRKAVRATKIPAAVITEKPVASTRPNAAITVPKPSVEYRISDENLASLEQVVNHLTLKFYSASTVRTYRAELIIFFQALGKHTARDLTTEDVKRYLLKCHAEGLSENTLHSRINGLKFYYEQVLGKERFFVDIPRPKRPLQLPKVLGEKEITRLFNAMTNKKHKAILFTAYSAGLRVSEVVNLKLSDVDSDRMQLFIERAKDKKDRYVGLSPVLLDILRGYIQVCRPKPTLYLFEGQGAPGTVYSARTDQKVFQLAREKAGIKKDVSFHSFRHYEKCKIMGSGCMDCPAFRKVHKNTSHNFLMLLAQVLQPMHETSIFFPSWHFARV